MLPVPARSPASTWTTGIPRWNAASAAPNAELVSPCTSTAAGKRPSRTSSSVASAGETSWNHWPKKSSKRSITEATRSFRRDRVSPIQSVTSAQMPASLKTSRTIRSCWPVVTTIGLKRSLSRNARMIGISLIASGRVPTTTSTLTLGAAAWGAAARMSEATGASEGGMESLSADRPER